MKAGSVSKFIFAVSAALTAGISNDFGLLAIILVAALTAFYTWGGRLREILKISKVAFWFFLLVFLLHLFSGSGKAIFAFWILNATIEGAKSGLLYGLKLIIFVFSGYIIFFRVDPAELLNPVERVIRHIGSPGKNISALLLSFSLALRFLPEFARQSRTNTMAFKSRGFDLEGGIFNKIKTANLLLISTFVSTFKRSESVSVALELKGYSLRYRQAVFPSLTFGMFDFFILLVSISMIFAGWFSK